MEDTVPRRTKIVATLGPSTAGEAAVRALLEAGTDAVRLNFSHGSQSEHSRAVRLVRRLAQEMERPVAIIQDLQGPKIRVASSVGEARLLAEGAEATLTTRAGVSDKSAIPVSYPPLPREVSPGDRIILGDGELELTVLSVSGPDVLTRVTRGGPLKGNQGLYLPDVALSAPPLTEKDIADLKFGLSLGLDYVALSFVRNADDVRLLKRAMSDGGRRLPVIAKLERREAIDHLDGIIAAADGVMVARGDLGLGFPLEEVPLLQKEIIRRANQAGILVITATQMLESMVESPRPTRAEVSDVANAILDGTDAVMLSGETAIGRYPAQTVAMMGRIAVQAETADALPAHTELSRLGHAHAMGRAACTLAQEIAADAIIVFTRSGYSARLVSKERPRVPVFAFTPSRQVYNQLALSWGVVPILLPFPGSAEEMIDAADTSLTARRLLRPRDTVVVARSSPIRARGWTNFLKIHRLRGEH